MSARVAVRTISDASALESKPLNVVNAEPQELTMKDEEDADGLLLHLIRTIALYLFLFLSQTTLAVTDKELAAFVSDAATPDLLDQETGELQRRLHAALLAWVQSEVNSNQFDGLLPEQDAFVVIKRLFRQHRTKAAVQCRALAALLTSYLTQLETSLVYCEPRSMLSSTLEYLVKKEKTTGEDEPVPLPMLYPLVNAVDLASIEQRECLDALSNLLRWLTAHDQSQTLFTRFASRHHVKFIRIVPTNDSISAVTAVDREESASCDAEGSTADFSETLSVCFVQMLLRYSDHIFRRDPQVLDVIPTLAYSDTEDDDASSEDERAVPVEPSSNESKDTIKCSSTQDITIPLAEKMPTNELVLPKIKQVKENDDSPAPENAANVVMKVESPVSPPGKASSRSLRKRKKREEKATTEAAKTTRRANKSRSKHPISEPEQQNTKLEIDEAWTNEELLPTVVCVGIAAAAGTLAAVLCVIFA